MPKNDLSVCIITNNEADDLPACIKSVNFAKDVVVVDQGSIDDTVQIAKGLGARVFHREFDNFANQKNFAISQCQSDWILVLDADERVSKELSMEIQGVISQQHEYLGYEIPFKHFFMGKWIKFGGQYPSYHLRLVLKRVANYKGDVHERFEIERKNTGILNFAILHYSYKDSAELFRKLDDYSTREAKNVRRNMVDLISKPLYVFVKNYFIKLGILDGLPGLVWHSAFAYYEYLVARKAVFQ